jgi:long-subunit fatty acid transport protein
MAGSLAGSSVPSVGGSFAGVTEPGALGLVEQPAASVRGPGPELAIDLGLLHTGLNTQLDNWDSPLKTGNPALQPTLLLSVPVGPLGFGAAVHSSYLRGQDLDPEGPQRFYGVRSGLSLIEGDLTASARPLDTLSFGAGARIGLLQYDAFKSTDLAATLNPALDPTPPLPYGEPLLEGSQAVGPLSQTTVSWIVGAALHFDVLQLDVSYRPAWKTTMVGPVQLVPSSDLQTSIDGRLEVTLTMPAHLMLGARIPVGSRWTLVPEVEWVGWARSGRNTLTISGLTLSATDPLLDELLGASGLSQADFLTSSEGTTETDSHWHDVVNGSLQTLWEPADDLELRAQLAVAPSAVETRWLHTSNLDFGTIVLGLGAAWQVAPQVRLALGGQHYRGLPRRVVDSPYDLEAPRDGAPALPSANGSYRLSLWRAGLTLQLMIPSQRESS